MVQFPLDLVIVRLHLFDGPVYVRQGMAVHIGVMVPLLHFTHVVNLKQIIPFMHILPPRIRLKGLLKLRIVMLNENGDAIHVIYEAELFILILAPLVCGVTYHASGLLQFFALRFEDTHRVLGRGLH
jgi:hypothetical protein